MKKWIIATVAVIILGILFFVFNTNEQELGDNYYYLPRYEALDCGYPGGGIIYKSSQRNSFEDIKIKGNVNEVSSNEDFILANQNDNTSYLKTANSSYALRYFIIVRKSDSVYGPYEKEEYLQRKEKLGVPQTLKLKEE